VITHVQWRVDCSVSKRDRCGIAVRSRNRIGHVAVRSGNDNLEVVLPLSSVGGSVFAQRACIVDTLDDIGCWRVITARPRAWDDSRIPFEIDVEGKAATLGIAILRASVTVISRQNVVAHVAISLARTLQIGEDVRVAGRSRGRAGCRA